MHGCTLTVWALAWYLILQRSVLERKKLVITETFQYTFGNHRKTQLCGENVSVYIFVYHRKS